MFGRLILLCLIIYLFCYVCVNLCLLFLYTKTICGSKWYQIKSTKTNWAIESCNATISISDDNKNINMFVIYIKNIIVVCRVLYFQHHLQNKKSDTLVAKLNIGLSFNVCYGHSRNYLLFNFIHERVRLKRLLIQG